MNITVIGVGHIGLVSAATFATWGHNVIGFDVDEDKVASTATGQLPFFEPDLAELVTEQIAAGQLQLTADPDVAYRDCQVAFSCVGTPPLPSGSPDLSAVFAAAKMARAHQGADMLLVSKSTVPAGTGRDVSAMLGLDGPDRPWMEVASNPEFLREGSAVIDALDPDRIVIGVSSERASELLGEVYWPLTAGRGVPLVTTDVVSAELVKQASNAFLATRLSFINAVANVCEQVGADVSRVAEGMGLDPRIGPSFLKAGLGYGGSCFPKDVDAFIDLGRQLGTPLQLLEEVQTINLGQRRWVFDQLFDRFGSLEGRTVTLLGAAFKPGTDDLREAPSMWLAARLLNVGADVRIWDPVAADAAVSELPGLVAAATLDDALADAHAVVVCTEWPELTTLEASTFERMMRVPFLIDARNVFEPASFVGTKVHHVPVGRPAHIPTSKRVPSSRSD